MRRSFKHTKSLKERLLQDAQELRAQARLLPVGPVRDAALKKARQAEAAAHMDDWLGSPGLQRTKNDDTRGPD
jgi:hypothetical protein